MKRVIAFLNWVPLKIGVVELAVVGLIALKLTGVLNISWWIVFSPILVFLVITVLMLVAAFLLLVVMYFLNEEQKINLISDLTRMQEWITDWKLRKRAREKEAREKWIS